MPTKPIVSLITGGSGGLGKVVTKAFLAQGHKVIVTYRDDKELKDLLEFVADYENNLAAHRVDVTDEASLEELGYQIEKKYKSINNLICLVGGYTAGTLGQEAGTTFDKLLTLNAKSFLLTVNSLLPYIEKGQGYKHIVTIVARAGLEPLTGSGIYSASKAALIMLTKSLAKELLANNITVNAIAPSTIDTAANRRVMPKVDHRKWVKPEEIADLVVYLCSDKVNALSGAIIPIYGLA